mgnify:CR=1 FL=1
MDWMRQLEVCKEVAVEAGEKILEIYNKEEDFQVEYKEGHMPLTIADKAANRVIVDRLKQEFPEISILSEEEQDDKSRLDNPLCFIVDPLDGTKEFIKRNGQFTVNIALSDHTESVMGVIYVPVTRELYYAARGYGAYREKIGEETEKQKLHVTDETEIEKLRFVMSSSHGDERIQNMIEKYGIKNFVAMGSSLKGCVIARGDAEVYYRYNPTMEWDTAAMQCIVEEAGAIFRQMDDTPMRYNREDSLNAKGFYIINRKENRL